ncbi:MAG: helix-turn-helix domain-containing protein, partial [Chloroflexota bacterium]
SQQGFERATTRDIAQAAQVAEGTLFHHFPNKMALLRGIMMDYYHRLQAEAERVCAIEQDAGLRLRALVVNHLRFANAEWQIVRLFSHYGRSGDKDFANAFYQLNKRYTQLFVIVIEMLKDTLKIRRTTPTPLIRDTLFGSMEHFMIGYFDRDRDYDLDLFVDQLLDLILFGVGGHQA